MRFTFDTAIERGDDELEVRVTYSVSPFIAATYWQPAEGGEVEIIAVKHEGKPLNTTDAEYEALLTLAQERAQDDMADEAAAQAEWRYQEYRDRQLMERWERGA